MASLSKPAQALVTPSASPPVSRSPSKRPRLDLPNDRQQQQPPPQPQGKRVSRSSSTASLDIDIQQQRHDSSTRLLNIWSSLAERYSKAIHEDDIIDLRTEKIIYDRGVVRSAKQMDIGYFSNQGAAATNEETEAEDEEEEEEEESDVDELDLLNNQNVASAQPKVLDAADMEDLRMFLEEEGRQQHDEEEEVEEQLEEATGDEEDIHNDGGVDDERQQLDPPRKEVLYVDDDESEDELISCYKEDEASAVRPVTRIPSTPPSSSSPMRSTFEPLSSSPPRQLHTPPPSTSSTSSVPLSPIVTTHAFLDHDEQSDWRSARSPISSPYQEIPTARGRSVSRSKARTPAPRGRSVVQSIPPSDDDRVIAPSHAHNARASVRPSLPKTFSAPSHIETSTTSRLPRFTTPRATLTPAAASSSRLPAATAATPAKPKPFPQEDSESTSPMKPKSTPLSERSSPPSSPKKTNNVSRKPSVRPNKRANSTLPPLMLGKTPITKKGKETERVPDPGADSGEESEDPLSLQSSSPVVPSTPSFVRNKGRKAAPPIIDDDVISISSSSPSPKAKKPVKKRVPSPEARSISPPSLNRRALLSPSISPPSSPSKPRGRANLKRKRRSSAGSVDNSYSAPQPLLRGRSKSAGPKGKGKADEDDEDREDNAHPSPARSSSTHPTFSYPPPDNSQPQHPPPPQQQNYAFPFHDPRALYIISQAMHQLSSLAVSSPPPHMYPNAQSSSSAHHPPAFSYPPPAQWPPQTPHRTHKGRSKSKAREPTVDPSSHWMIPSSDPMIYKTPTHNHHPGSYDPALMYSSGTLPPSSPVLDSDSDVDDGAARGRDDEDEDEHVVSMRRTPRDRSRARSSSRPRMRARSISRKEGDQQQPKVKRRVSFADDKTHPMVSDREDSPEPPRAVKADPSKDGGVKEAKRTSTSSRGVTPGPDGGGKGRGRGRGTSRGSVRK